MIGRVWSARANKESLSVYLEHFSNDVLPGLKKCDGYVSALILTRELPLEPAANVEPSANGTTNPQNLSEQNRDSQAASEAEKERDHEIVVTTFWKSMQAIDAFAGADREEAVVATEAVAILQSFDTRVRHYTVDALEPFPPRL
jgi:hypothetical protein